MESSCDQNQIKHFQSLYGDRNNADVWFIFEKETVPGHKILLIRSQLYRAELLKHNNFQWTENNRIDMRKREENEPENFPISLRNLSIESFKEFLKYFYYIKPKLTINNIEDILNKAEEHELTGLKQMCEDFLKQSMEKDNLFWLYKLASIYNLIGLKEMCVSKMNMNDEILRPNSFVQYPYEFLKEILECDSYPCEEIDIFNACIAWAKDACKRNNLNPSNVEHIRSMFDQQNSSLLYQIRFTSMTNKEFATCVRSYPGLFDAEELEEMICMVGHNENLKSKFNWTSRYFNRNVSDGRHLECSRFKFIDKGNTEGYKIGKIEATRFTCNRPTFLTGIVIEAAHDVTRPIYIQINEINSDEYSCERYYKPFMVRFSEKRNVKHSSYLKRIHFDEIILMKPNYSYEIRITFANHPNDRNSDITSKATFKRKVRVDFDTVFHFKSRGVVASLYLSRFNDRNCLKKIIHSPTFWVLIMVFCGIVTAACFIWIYRKTIF